MTALNQELKYLQSLGFRKGRAPENIPTLVQCGERGDTDYRQTKIDPSEEDPQLSRQNRVSELGPSIAIWAHPMACMRPVWDISDGIDGLESRIILNCVNWKSLESLSPIMLLRGQPPQWFHSKNPAPGARKAVRGKCQSEERIKDEGWVVILWCVRELNPRAMPVVVATWGMFTDTLI
ncbi:hypothetical protein B0J17DRAFT_625361 [Rhizoctonia solani]|nr:hypothetical protein B0J17DRAFT_625361 [Rhizoctonia solani]